MFSDIKKYLEQKLRLECPEIPIDKLKFDLPKNSDHGFVSLPVFSLSKELKLAPSEIAQKFASLIKSDKFVSKIETVQGFINFHFNIEYLSEVLLKNCQKNKIGYKNKINKNIVIDYSSPNIAKPMGIGHLRATVIGNSLKNIALSQGYDVIGLNYLGDWGVQFGKLAYAYELWAHEYPFETEAFESLFKLYVRFHEESENNPDLENKGSECFYKMEQGDEKLLKLWKKIVDISLLENEKIYSQLKIKFDLVQGESFHNKDLEGTIEFLKKLNLLSLSEGAQVVFLDDLPPCLIQKSDGASLYATRDIASAIYRHDILKADMLIYVVGNDQNLHFQQVFQVLKKMNLPWFQNCHHIAFGMYRFKDMGKMQSRKGKTIFITDVLKRSIELSLQKMTEKNPDLENKVVVSQQIGIGAIVFNDLKNDRNRNVDFDWDQVLNFEGDSGPYVQYVGVRCKSLIKKYDKKIEFSKLQNLNQKEERFLIQTLLIYDHILEISFESFKPSLLANYLLEVCRAFNNFYHTNRVLGVDPVLENSRMCLVFLTLSILNQGMEMLGVEIPEAM